MREPNHNFNMPIIRIEIDGMKQVMCRALTEHLTQIDQYVQETLEHLCSEDSLRTTVAQTLGSAFEQVWADEVEKFFKWGPGREVVKAAIHEALGVLVKGTEESSDGE